MNLLDYTANGWWEGWMLQVEKERDENEKKTPKKENDGMSWVRQQKKKYKSIKKTTAIAGAMAMATTTTTAT